MTTNKSVVLPFPFSEMTLCRIEGKEGINCEACFGKNFTLGLFLKFYFCECHIVFLWLFMAMAVSGCVGGKGAVIEGRF